MRTWAVLLCLLLVLAGCAARTPEGAGGNSSPVSGTPAPGSGESSGTAGPGPGAVRAGEPRLILDLAPGEDPDVPGQLPSRVGGIAHRGPLALAVEGSSLYLVDAAKSRIMEYDLRGRLAGTIPTPWLDDQLVDLAVSPWGLVVTLPRVQYTVADDGRLLEVSARSWAADPQPDPGKGPWPIGKDRHGFLYDRDARSTTEPVVRRLDRDGRPVASLPIRELGEVHDWYISRDGGLYALTYLWGQDGIERVRAFEVFPPLTISSGPGGMDPIPAPAVLGHPLPPHIRLSTADWPPLAVAAEADRWSIWQLLASAEPIGEAEGPFSDWGPRNRNLSIDATLNDGSTLSMTVRNDELHLAGMRYRIPFYDGLYAVVDHLRLSAEALQAALTEADSVRLALLDLPGVERELTPQERDQLRRSLAGVIPASNAAGPQPLDPPFPRYGIRLEGTDWQATLLLHGERYLDREGGGSALHDGELFRVVRELLPVPPLEPADAGYLYLADRLEIGQGSDLTRWKNTVVRMLVGPEVVTGYQGGSAEPFLLTFWVKGEPVEVRVDADGFTYRGVHYPHRGLWVIPSLQGVP